MKTDLHIHSTYSDGELAPLELIRRAAGVGLEQISITDHDNVYAYDEIDAASLPAGMRLVPGVELDVVLVHLGLGIRDLEILGYGVDVRHPRLRRHVDDMIEQRRNRGRALAQWLNERLGVTVWPPELLRERTAVTKQSVTAAFLARHHIGSWSEARKILRNVGRLPKVRKPAAEEAIEIVHEAGGKAVLSHPARTSLESVEDAVAALDALRAAGLDGYELHYPYDRSSRKGPRFDMSAIQAYWPDALTTGGSDSHMAERLGSFHYDAPAWE